jgi:antitoxin ParD1/3/4
MQSGGGGELAVYKFLVCDMIKSYRSLKMRTTQAISVTLPHEMAQMVKSKVASGEYASDSEVIREGLRSLMARDNALEKWLREEVIAAYDEAKENPDILLNSATLRQNLSNMHNANFGGE